ncbi:hypothetical protein BIW11_12401, partial [Tropilaelaps mercedesae]
MQCPKKYQRQVSQEAKWERTVRVEAFQVANGVVRVVQRRIQLPRTTAWPVKHRTRSIQNRHFSLLRRYSRSEYPRAIHLGLPPSADDF